MIVKDDKWTNDVFNAVIVTEDIANELDYEVDAWWLIYFIVREDCVK